MRYSRSRLAAAGRNGWKTRRDPIPHGDGELTGKGEPIAWLCGHADDNELEELADRWAAALVAPGLLLVEAIAVAARLGQAHALDIGLVRDWISAVATSPGSHSRDTLLLAAAGVLAVAGPASGRWPCPVTRRSHRRPRRLQLCGPPGRLGHSLRGASGMLVASGTRRRPRRGPREGTRRRRHPSRAGRNHRRSIRPWPSLQLGIRSDGPFTHGVGQEITERLRKDRPYRPRPLAYRQQEGGDGQ
jgi:hypothetical protein